MSWRTPLSPQKRRAAAEKLHTEPALTEGPSLDDWLGGKSPKKNKRTPKKSEDRPIVVFPRGKTGAIGRQPRKTTENYTDEYLGDDAQNVEVSDPFASEFNTQTQTQTRHQRRRQKQWRTWNFEVLPSLIEPYMELLHQQKPLCYTLL